MPNPSAFMPHYRPYFPAQTSSDAWDFPMVRTTYSGCGVNGVNGANQMRGTGALAAGNYMGRVPRVVSASRVGSNQGARIRNAFAGTAVLSGLGAARDASAGGVFGLRGMCDDQGVQAGVMIGSAVSSIAGQILGFAAGGTVPTGGSGVAKGGDAGLRVASNAFSTLGQGAASVYSQACQAAGQQNMPQVGYASMTGGYVNSTTDKVNGALNTMGNNSSPTTNMSPQTAANQVPGESKAFAVDGKTLMVVGGVGIGVLALVFLLRR